MKWFYAANGKKAGPVSDEEINQLVQQGTIKYDTLVRNEQVSKWVRYGSIGAAITGKISQEEPQNEAGSGSARTELFAAPSLPDKSEPTCTSCGRAFSDEDLIKYGDAKICADCKPDFFQKVKEGAGVAVSMVYAGFWIRFGAKVIDGLIMSVVNVALSFVGGLAVSPSFASPGGQGATDAGSAMAMIVVSILQLLLAAIYSTFFVGKFGATPGKMACGIKVVTPEYGSVSYARALGRHFAEFLSSIILGIGFIMAAFDEEKRTLHDRICNTRVIRK